MADDWRKKLGEIGTLSKKNAPFFGLPPPRGRPLRRYRLSLRSVL